ncbi:diaminopimelate epimerase [Candidatus Babeliales bacterium]|nr:diaminopimelate epimerase [Candidatus Babeliales bacterium]
MFSSFFKVQSLGNDFILFDWQLKKESKYRQILQNPEWKKFVINSCNRNFSIGANGILILLKNQKLNIPQVLIFNSDGSQAKICLNGIRCIAHYLHSNYNFSKNFKIKIGNQIIECKIINKKNELEIINSMKPGQYIEIKTITILNQKFTGHIVNVGNPHFLVFQKKDIKYLKKYGPLIENYKYFKNKTNVEFVWQKDNKPSPRLQFINKNNFNMIVYERGCGITLACSSGAYALVTTLYYLKKIKINEKIIIHMPGGNISCWVTNNKKINIQAKAHIIFKGKYCQDILFKINSIL